MFYAIAMRIRICVFFLASVVFFHIYFIVIYCIFPRGNHLFKPFLPNPNPLLEAVMKKVMVSLVLFMIVAAMIQGCVSPASVTDNQLAEQKYANFAHSDISDLTFLKGQTTLEWLNLDSNLFLTRLVH